MIQVDTSKYNIWDRNYPNPCTAHTFYLSVIITFNLAVILTMMGKTTLPSQLL